MTVYSVQKKIIRSLDPAEVKFCYLSLMFLSKNNKPNIIPKWQGNKL